jgi:hypothetical protein
VALSACSRLKRVQWTNRAVKMDGSRIKNIAYVPGEEDTWQILEVDGKMLFGGML